ncbi:hypothetical protein GCM10022221_78320 [Actinocorallia aurea]
MKTARTAAAAVLLALLAGTGPAHAAAGPPKGASDGLVAQLTEVVESFFCTIFDNCPKPKPAKKGAHAPYKPGEHYGTTTGKPYKPKKRDASELPGYGPSPIDWPYGPPIVG